MEELSRLYSPFIKEQNEKPFHFEKKGDAQFTLKAYNPVCGDRYEIFISGNLREIHFHGYGCAISKASTSLLTKTLTNKPAHASLELCNEFLDFIDKKIDASQLPLGSNFDAFAGVHDFPERYDCVTLSWKAMKSFLENQKVKL